jgi:hypothetical protein
MKFHVLLPGCVDTPAITQPWESALTGADIVRIAQVAEESRFEGLLIPEHFVVAADHTETTGRHFLDATTAQAVIAGATNRIKLGSMVTILPLHNPIVLARKRQPRHLPSRLGTANPRHIGQLNKLGKFSEAAGCHEKELPPSREESTGQRVTARVVELGDSGYRIAEFVINE